jgi:hypothetical protein
MGPATNFVENVKTTFQLYVLLQNSSLYFASFKKLFEYQSLEDQKNDQVVSIECPRSPSYGMSLSKVEGVNKSAYINDKCHVESRYLHDVDVHAKSNLITWGFFRNATAGIFERYIPWKPQVLSDPFYDRLVELLGEQYPLPTLLDCDLYFKTIDSTLFLLILPSPYVWSTKKTGFLLVQCEKYTPVDSSLVPSLALNQQYSLKFHRAKNECNLKFELLSTEFQNQLKSGILESMNYMFASSQSVEAIGIWESNGAKELFESITQAYNYAMVKSIYFLLLQEQLPNSLDISYCFPNSVQWEFRLDMTDFVAVSESQIVDDELPDYIQSVQWVYRDILERDFCPLSIALEKENEQYSNIYYYNCPEIFKGSSLEELVATSQHPLFLRVYFEEGELKLPGEKILPKFQQKYAVMEPFELPSTNGTTMMEWVVEVISIPEISSDSQSQQRKAVETVKKSVAKLLQDYTLLGLLNLINCNIDGILQFAIQVLERRGGEMVTDLREVCNTEFAFMDAPNTLHYKYDLGFVDPSCQLYFKQQLIRIIHQGIQLKSWNDYFYVMNSGSNESMPFPFWFIISLLENSCAIHFFCQAVPHDDIQSMIIRIKHILDESSYLAIQKFLLKELYQTHIARDASQIRPNDFVPSVNSQDDIFYHYTCAVQFSHFFNLHPRLTPQMAINNLLSILHAISVSNRSGVLAYSEHFFMKFDEHTEQDSSKPTYERGFWLKVYGLEQPGSEISEDFIKMIDQKLDIMIQNILGALLARNYFAKLSKADVQFLVPVEKNVEPSFHTTYLLVRELENLHLYIVLMRQFLTLFLTPLQSNDFPSILNSFYSQKFNQRCSMAEKGK